jgi:hypothetical protein
VTLHDLNILEFVLINRVVAQRAPFPRAGRVLIVSQVLEHARPAINVATLCDPWHDHVLQRLHAYWALHVICINHVEDNWNNILPFYVFVLIVEIECIVRLILPLLVSDDKLKRRLNTVIFERSIPLWTAGLRSGALLPTIWVVVRSLVVILMVIIVIETQEEIRFNIWGRSATLWNLLLHSFHHLKFLITTTWLIGYSRRLSGP